jgi:hypothetical protein
MAEDLNRFEALLARWVGAEVSIVTIAFSIEDKNDALERRT